MAVTVLDLLVLAVLTKSVVVGTPVADIIWTLVAPVLRTLDGRV